MIAAPSASITSQMERRKFTHHIRLEVDMAEEMKG
jgi:hypothetical protein